MGLPPHLTTTYEKQVNSRFFAHLCAHTVRNIDSNHINYKIYHLLCNPYTFVNAYATINKIKRFYALDEDKIMRLFNLIDAQAIADQFKEGTYEKLFSFKNLKPKLGQTLSKPGLTHKVVQQAICGILETIYEPEFRRFAEFTNGRVANYGFRPNTSAFDAVAALKMYGKETTFAITSDLNSSYTFINHRKLMFILEYRIKDKKFLRLIYKLLKIGIMHENLNTHSLEGVTQGEIVASMLFNIYMFEFDKYVYLHIFKKVLVSPFLTVLKSSDTKPLSPQTIFQKENSHILSTQTTLGSSFSNRVRLSSSEIAVLPSAAVYARYADHWVFFLTGFIPEVQNIKDHLAEYLLKELFMVLSLDKTDITRVQKGINFLGYSIKTTSLNLKNKPNLAKNFGSGKLAIYPDKTRLFRYLIRMKVCQGSDLWPVGVRSWSALDEYNIVLKYRRIMVGLTNYYRNCDSSYVLNRISYILQYSCAKTIALRKKITMSQVFKKYSTSLRIEKIVHKNDGSQRMIVYFPTFTNLRSQRKFKKHKTSVYDQSILSQALEKPTKTI